MTETKTERASIRVRVQRVGTFLSSMIMPNIGAFIAWGLITAIFIPKGLLLIFSRIRLALVHKFHPWLTPWFSISSPF